MSKLTISRPKQRIGLFIPMKGNKDNPNLVFPLTNVDRSELDELIRAILEKQGVTDETEIQQVIDVAEQSYEVRVKVAEARAEIRRLMELKKKGAKLMSVGFRKWRQAFYPAISK